jgi:hypothetical protein
LTRVPAEKLRHFVIYNSEAEAAAGGFQPRENGKRAGTG